MATKNKTIQLQSPENYIRSRARNLQLFECLVSEGWGEVGMANVIVTRKHTNGNVTSAIYLVDLYCLGVKDTMFLFNVSEREYREKLQGFDEKFVFTKIEYILAHNIIYAAIEFAGDYGFNPHKTFTAVTKYMLEEDTDDIELIDIECGLNGKPAYFQGQDENTATVTRIRKQLERAAGKGNYDFTVLADDYDDKIEMDQDNEDFDNNESGRGMSFAEAEEVFRKYESEFDSLDKQQINMFVASVNVICNTAVDYNLYQKYYNEFFDDLDIEIEIEELPLELLGSDAIDTNAIESLTSRLMTIIALPKAKVKKAYKMLAELKSEFTDIPLISFLEIYIDEDRDSANIQNKINQYKLQYPDYPLFRIADLILININGPVTENDKGIVPLSELFTGRKSLHLLEMMEYLMYVLTWTIISSDKSRLASFQDALVDLEYPDEIMDSIYPAIIAEKVRVVYKILNLPG